MTSLTIVLLCKGRGADAKSYKPDRDDSQWWSRRDALVRCVTAALFSSRRTSNRDDVTMVLIFDEDWSFFEMSYRGAQDKEKDEGKGKGSSTEEAFLPTERAVVTLWKESASKPNQTIDHNGLLCRLTPSHIISTEQPAFENKRQVLDSLQKHCTIDFLRHHGLNASRDVLLRKTNMTKLLHIWQTWNATKPTHNNSPPLEVILNNLLLPKTKTTMTTTTEQPTTIAGILHESSNSELPCFLHDNIESSHTDVAPTSPPLASPSPPTTLRIFVILGAVRDMHPQENHILRKCCTMERIPLIPVRVGPVPEFTSKIVAVVVFHHGNGKLGSAMWNLYQHQHNNIGNNKSKKGINNNTILGSIPKQPKDIPPTMTITAKTTSKTTTTALSTSPSQAELHVLLNLALDSKQISVETKYRVRSLWRLVRVTVCTLWRSRLAGTTTTTSTTGGGGATGGSNNPLSNTLTIVFRDQTSLTIRQDDLVQDMAEQHQAAPSEYQILKAIQNKLRDDLVPFNKRLTYVAKACTACIDLTRTGLPTTKGRCLDFIDLFYNSIPDFNATGKVLILLGDEESSNHVGGLLRKTGVDPIPTNLIHRDIVDWEAASIVMIQHLMYQHRLLPMFRERESTNGNPKRARTH